MANCELCGCEVRDPKTVMLRGNRVMVCWDHYRSEMRKKQQGSKELKPLSETLYAEVTMMELQHEFKGKR